MSNRPGARYRPMSAPRTKAKVSYLPPLDLRARVTPGQLTDGQAEWAVDAGALVARVPATIEGEPDADLLATIRKATHDHVIDMVDSHGGQRLGPVEWYTFTPETMGIGLVLVEDDPDLAAAIRAHPDWWLVIAMVVAIPADRLDPNR